MLQLCRVGLLQKTPMDQTVELRLHIAHRVPPVGLSCRDQQRPQPMRPRPVSLTPSFEISSNAGPRRGRALKRQASNAARSRTDQGSSKRPGRTPAPAVHRADRTNRPWRHQDAPAALAYCRRISCRPRDVLLQIACGLCLTQQQQSAHACAMRHVVRPPSCPGRAARA